MPIKVSDASFQADVLDAKKPVLVDFWAEWCGPCRMIAPALDELSNELGDKVTIAKLNIDENPHVPTKYGVRGIPTMMIFHQGQVAATKVGALPKSKIKEWIESSIKPIIVMARECGPSIRSTGFMDGPDKPGHDECMG